LDYRKRECVFRFSCTVAWVEEQES
jgi:hypothetical protein